MVDFGKYDEIKHQNVSPKIVFCFCDGLLRHARAIIRNVRLSIKFKFNSPSAVVPGLELEPASAPFVGLVELAASSSASFVFCRHPWLFDEITHVELFVTGELNPFTSMCKTSSA